MDERVLVFLADLLRWATISMAATIVGVTLKVLQLHYIASSKAFRKGDVRGILPMHVWLISSSYIILILATVSQNIARIGDRPTVHLAINSISYTLGLIALWLILRYQRRKTGTESLPYRRKDDTSELPIIERKPKL